MEADGEVIALANFASKWPLLSSTDRAAAEAPSNDEGAADGAQMSMAQKYSEAATKNAARGADDDYTHVAQFDVDTGSAMTMPRGVA